MNPQEVHSYGKPVGGDGEVSYTVAADDTETTHISQIEILDSEGNPITAEGQLFIPAGEEGGVEYIVLQQGSDEGTTHDVVQEQHKLIEVCNVL